MAHRYRVIILPRASADLQELFEYIERQSPQNASGVARQIIDAIDSLEELPHRYEVHASSRDPSRVVRSMPVPPFIVYYRTDEKRLSVHILTIRHGARRQPKRFK
jgi:toxin ParE1/3/4